MKNFIPPDFIQVPWLVVSCSSLQPLDIKVYGFVYWLERLKDGKCIASNLYIAKALSCSSVSVQNSLTRLEKQGFIKRVFDQKKNRKEIKTLVLYSKVSSNDDRVSSNDDRGVSSNDDQKKKRLEEEKHNKLFSVWNEQKITVHKKMSNDIKTQIRIVLRDYEVSEIEDLIKLYSTVYHGKEYYWTYKWNLYEFLKRGLKSFNGKTKDDFKKASSQSTFSQNQKSIKI